MFRYEINFWDEFIQKSSFEKGFVCANSYGDAANKIIEFYGKDNVEDIKLCELENILTDDEIFEEMNNEE